MHTNKLCARELQDKRQVVYGSEQLIRKLASELMALGLPTGMRQIARDTYSIDLPREELETLERLHISAYMARKGRSA